MKKRNLFLLSIAAFMTLCACGSRPQSKSSSEESKQPESSSEPAPASSSVEPVQSSSSETASSSESQPASSEEPYHYEDPDVELDDLEDPNYDIDFDEITDTCMINPKAKTYIDAMEKQEKTLDKPYHFSSLYGPDDYAKIAAASDKGDGTTYAAADTGGVDVCQILNRNDYNNDCKNYPIVLSWDDDGTFGSAKVKFWSTEDQSDVREVPVTVSGGKAQASLDNLYRARKYRAQVIDGSDASNSIEFTTGDYPRTITMGGVHNVRDIGGYVTSYGVRTNQGLIYRGYYIDDKSGGHGVNYSAEVQRVQEEVMKIGLELDLQKASETNGRTASALNSTVTPCDYKCKTLISYENFLGEESRANLPEVMHDIANAEEKHVYFHCWGGADRTGMLAFFINAICGVSYTDLIEDLELTTQTNNKRCHMHNSSSAHYPKFMNAFVNEWADFDPDATVNENCYNWLVDVANVARADLEKIREIMIPGYKDGNLEEDALIPEYTPSGEWQSDELAHWKVAEENENVKCNWHRHDGTECSICGHGKQGGGQGQQEEPEDDDFTQVISHVWTVSKTENNSDGKQYQQLSDASKGKVGVRMLQSAISSTSIASFDSDGKLPKEENQSVTYQFKAPKAGTYQLIMNGRVSDTSYKLGERGITVTLNGNNVPIDGDSRDGGLVGTGDNDFVVCPSITLTGNEDTLTVACRYYRIAFNQSAYLVLAEH